MSEESEDLRKVTPEQAACPHMDFYCECDTNRLADKDGGQVTGFWLDVRIRCRDCDLPFRFIGLPAGLDLNGASTSANAEEGRFAIAPRGKAISMLDGAPHGFSIRQVESIP